MKTSFPFQSVQSGFLSLVAAAGVLMILPTTSKAADNTFYGTGALQSGTATGSFDSAFGFDALFHDTTGEFNTGVGTNALLSLTTGNFNTATGVNVLQSTTTGSYNTADGEAALSGNTLGSFDTAIGLQALHLNTTGTANTAEGAYSLYNCTTDSQETALGYGALFSDTVGFGGTPNQNVALGYEALYSSTDGFENVAAGYQALFHSKQGDQNTAVGYQALLGITTGMNNIAIGDNAGSFVTTGSANIDIGHPGVAGDSGTIRIGETQTATFLAGVIHGNGSGLTSLPASAVTGTIPGSQIAAGSVTGAQLAPNLTLGGNTTIGNEISLPATTSGTSGVLAINGGVFLSAFGGNIFVGGAGNFTMTGGGNVASGAYALSANTTGVDNTASGVFSLYSNTSGFNNTASGVFSLYSNTSGINNTASGARTLASNTTGVQNTASGVDALEDNTTGSNNTSSGEQALVYNITGFENTASGVNALLSNTSGFENTASGVNALRNNTSGENNTAAGYMAGFNLTTGGNNIDLGDYNPSNSTADDVAGEADTIRIGEVNTQAATYIAGIYGESYNENDGQAVFIDSTGKLGTLPVTPSSRRFKKEIKPMGDTSSVILSLKPVTFQYIKPEYDPRGGREFGLIAEEVEKLCPDLVAHKKDGTVYGIRYDAVNAMLLNEFLKEHRRVEEQGEAIAAQSRTNACLAKKVASQEEEIANLTASLKEQASLLRRVSAQIQLARPAPRMVTNNY